VVTFREQSRINSAKRRSVVAQGLGEIGDAAFELFHGALKLALVGFVVEKKLLTRSATATGSASANSPASARS